MPLKISKKSLAALALISLFAVQPAHARAIWTCKYHPSGEVNATPLEGSLIEVDATKLEGFVDDYTGKRTPFNIIESTNGGLIAVSPSHTLASKDGTDLGLKVIMLNKKTGGLLMSGAQIRTLYEDVWQGQCKRNRP